MSARRSSSRRTLLHRPPKKTQHAQGDSDAQPTRRHPGGIDYDGQYVWVPAAEYRPNSRAIVYTVDPKTYRVTERFRVKDHAGGVVRDRATGQVHGVSWGSRTLYNWTPTGRQLESVPNESHLLDYQDCDYVARGKQLCGGVTTLPGPKNTSYDLGGLALLDLRTNRILHEIPFPYFSPTTNHNATRNPVALETTPPNSASSPPPTTAKIPPAPRSRSTSPHSSRTRYRRTGSSPQRPSGSRVTTVHGASGSGPLPARRYVTQLARWIIRAGMLWVWHKDKRAVPSINWRGLPVANW